MRYSHKNNKNRKSYLKRVISSKKQELKHDNLNKLYLSKIKGMEKILINHEHWNKDYTQRILELDGFSYKRTNKQNIAYILETKHSINPKTLNHGMEQLERAEKIFIPHYEKQNNIKFDKIVKLLLNPYKIRCIGVSKR